MGILILGAPLVTADGPVLSVLVAESAYDRVGVRSGPGLNDSLVGQVNQSEWVAITAIAASEEQIGDMRAP